MCGKTWSRLGRRANGLAGRSRRLTTWRIPSAKVTLMPRPIRPLRKALSTVLAGVFLNLLLSALSANAGPGYALSFDGVDDYVDMQAAVIPTSGSFTVECWVYCAAPPNAYCHILSQGSSGNAFYIGTDPANNFRFGDTWSAPGVAFPFGGWHHLAVTSTSGNTVFYLDGNVRLIKGSAIANSTAGAFSVEFSTNLLNWHYLGPAIPRYQFTDTNAPALPQRYYRLRWP